MAVLVRPRRTAVIAMAIVVAVLASACSGASQHGQRDLNSVMVGSEVALPNADADVVSEIGIELAALTGPLQTWWSTLNDSSISSSTWLQRAPGLLDQMRSGVDRITSRLGPDRDVHVRDTFEPYVTQWRQIITVLDRLRDRVANGDQVGEQQAVDDYNTALAAIRALDAARVKRVVDVFGAANARQLLAGQGIDPSEFGLGA